MPGPTLDGVPGTVSRRRSAITRALLAGTAALLAAGLTGCAQFPAQQPQDWQTQKQLKPQAGPQPQLPGRDAQDSGGAAGGPGGGTGGDTGNAAPPHREGCKDSDPAVIATCLNPVYALAVLPGNVSLLAGERATGRILRVQKDQPAMPVATIPVDGAGGGGLTGLVISPSYREDQLIYAYVTTPTDNRIVRIAPNDVPKPVLTGIPRGSSDNAGAMIMDDKGALLVATGDAGDPAAAANPTSLAGKVLRVDTYGKPAADNPTPGSPIYAAGLRAPGGLCQSPTGGTAWVTDQGVGRDLLYPVKPGPLVASWNWPDRPGVTGCQAVPGYVGVALSNTSQWFALKLAKDGVGFSGQPMIEKNDNYGRVRAVAVGPDGLGWGGTANKEGGKTVSSDDRVYRLPHYTQGKGVD